MVIICFIRFILGSADGSERRSEGEGLFVTLSLYGIATTNLEGRAADKAGTALHGEWHGDCIDEFAASIVDVDSFVLDNVDTYKQDGRLLSRLFSGNGRHLTHTATDREDGAALNDKRGKVAVETFFG